MVKTNPDGSQTLDLGNNEQITRGVFPEVDGTWLALTWSRSRSFKTELGAKRWYQRQTGKTL